MCALHWRQIDLLVAVADHKTEVKSAPLILQWDLVRMATMGKKKERKQWRDKGV